MRIVAVLAVALILGGALVTFTTTPEEPPDATGAPGTGDLHTVSPSPPSSPSSSASMAATPLPSGFTFYDDFDGTGLSPVWLQNFNFEGIENTWSSSQATVRDGMLVITARRSGTGWVSQLLDTKTTWTQLYGRFEARMKIPLGRGLWPAFWSYRAGGGREAEIDTMEVCANPLGTNDGNDASLLHNAVHWTDGQASGDTRWADLSLDFHVYAVEWRPDHIAFFLDGKEVYRFSDGDHIPREAMPLIVNLAVGGEWCGPSDPSTPDGATLVVDWIRARP